MRWINQADLNGWADRIGARETFPEMVRHLILATVRDLSEIRHMRFPGGENSQVRGYDGELDLAVEYTNVPAGRSVWEFGTNKGVEGKFKKDYETRAEEMTADDRANTTFVFVTPRVWDKPKKKLPDFVKDYRKRRDFKNVLFIDGAMLEEWLESRGAVGALYAKTVIGRVPRTDARSTDEFWAEYSARFKPKLTEQVALSARADQASEILRHLSGSAGQLTFVGDGPDEVSAVAVAAIRTAPEEQRRFLEARTLIVDTDSAARELACENNYAYVVSPTVRETKGALAQHGPLVDTLDFLPTRKGVSRLERPSIRDMGEAMQSLGLDPDEAEDLARKCGRSLTILERRDGSRRPDWANAGEHLLPALLAGRWNNRQDGDRRILADLSGLDYDAFEAKLRDHLTKLDSPLDHQVGLWKLRAPVDAFANLSHLVTEKDLTKLANAAIEVLSTYDPPDIVRERHGTSDAPFSSFLREGMATTLLIIAAMHEELGFEAVDDPGGFVEGLVHDLPGLRDDPRIVLSLERELTYLMEASPDPLLDALERQLEGDAPLAKVVFEETTRSGVPRNRLPNLMWALEMQAWDPKYLTRVALLLGKLVSLDPGGRSGNRPISSLRDIFVAWQPGTNASLIERLAAIDAVIGRYPKAGWQLVSALLPKAHDVKSPTQRPRFREAGASERETLTRGMVWETYEEITDRALALVDAGTGRWDEMVEVFPAFSPDRRNQFLDMLAARVDQSPAKEREELRRTLSRLVKRHARFPEANWSLPAIEVDRLREIVKSLESDDPFEQARILFDEVTPFGSGDYIAAEKEISSQRAECVAALAGKGGAEVILQLAGAIRHAGLAASAVAQGIEDEGVVDDLLSSGDPDEPASEFLISLSGVLRAKHGANFLDHVRDLATRHGWSDKRLASMILAWPDEPETWDAVEVLSADASEYYWSTRRPWRFEGPSEQIETLVGKFLAVGRAGAALVAVHPHEAEIPIPLVWHLLATHVTEINERDHHDDMDGFHISELFKSLRDRNDVDELELARWEYAFFPALEHHDERLALFDQMAVDPEFFVSIIDDVYVKDDAKPEGREASDQQRNRANISHRILMANHVVPGESDEGVDQDMLDAWVDGMIEEGRKAKLTKVVPSYVGRVLAHAAPVNDIWPPVEVASVIERLKSTEVEQGIMIERFNMRGVYTKAMFEGGRQERGLAETNRRWADHHRSRPRTMAMLKAMAKRWEKDAKRADDDADKDRVRFE